MNKVYAFIVGIDRYDEPGWNTPGPCENAVSVANQLLDTLVQPPTDMFVYLEPQPKTLEDRIRSLEGRGVRVARKADWETLDTFWRQRLTATASVNSQLLVYWSGHGYAENDGTRILICPDYTNAGLRNRVFNATIFLRHLCSPCFGCFSEQIFLADVCGGYTERRFEANRQPPDNVTTPRYVAYFASPEGEYAHGTEGRGVFTEIVLKVLRGFNSWPERESFTRAMNAALAESTLKAFRIAAADSAGSMRDMWVGALPAKPGNTCFAEVLGLLAEPNLSDSVFRPHYQLTVADLGIPELHRAQGLTGMVRELASLSDATAPSQVSFGLLQFVTRLLQVPELEQRIAQWLARLPDGLGNTLANVNERLRQERELKVLVVEVTTNTRGDMEGFEAFLRTQALLPVPGVVCQPRKTENWAEFCERLNQTLVDLDTRHNITDLQIHFLVDPPLFDLPFHSVPVSPGGGLLGEQYVVLVRYRDRMRSPRTVIRKAWEAYANSLRPVEPSQLKLIPVASVGGDSGALLPSEKGFCYSIFLVEPFSQGGRNNISAKDTLRRALVLGVPYLYWLHKWPVPDALLGIEAYFSACLEQLDTLDDFPRKFTEERMNGNRFACEATLLWDDPSFNPFTLATGIRLK